MMFSILVPVYNTEKYIVECIESAIKQSYHDWELILLDDGSSDDSLSILNYYADKDNRIKVYTQNNQGLILTRRSLIRYSKGAYILFLDSDDYIDSDLLKKAKTNIEKYKSDLVIYKYRKVTNTGEHINHKTYSLCEDDDCVVEDFNIIIKEMVTTTNLNNLVCKIVKRELYISDDYDYSRTSALKHGEDLLQSIPILFNAKIISILNSELYFYRQIKTSMSNHPDINKIFDIFIVRSALLNYLKNSKYNNIQNLRLFYKEIVCISFNYIITIYSWNSIVVSKKMLNDIANNPLIKSSKPYIRDISTRIKRLIISNKINLVFIICSKLYLQFKKRKQSKHT